MTQVTAKQQEVLDFITAEIRTKGRPPTVREIGTHFGITSPNGVICHLRALERKGLIERDPETSRNIRLLRADLGDREQELLAASRGILSDDEVDIDRLEEAIKAYD